ncbi:LysM peptidoglycan-binding domain-containing protein [Desulfopila sp. IMCC35006]|nr:LysM peptidoglycan-binding domain-containing protein [Desulfopila sp. IMCC35006]
MKASAPVQTYPAGSVFTCLSVFLLLLFTSFYCQASAPDNRKFPHYKAIGKNVAFWEKIYSHYSLTEAVIHDSEDLAKIYEVIPLLGEDVPGAAKYNDIFQQHAKEKYRAILKKIAVQKPTTRSEIRVAALFSGKNRTRDLAQAAENVRSQRGQKERFLAGVIHSGRYIKEIKRLFRSYNLPEELAYLPHVESSFNFNAYSKYGAAGIWQFTRETGKGYLTIDHVVDERLDPILAAHAAAKYLKNSYEALNNWPLALTSYNYGLSGMLRAVNEQGNYENVFKYYNKGYFKFASKNFYSEFLAALKVARQLEQNPRIQIDRAQPTRYLNLPGYVHISEAGRHFGVSAGTIQSLNPALQSSVINGEKRIPKGYVLRLPATKGTNRAVASIPSTLYQKQQKPSVFHRVRKGDTAVSIARLHGISVKSLIKANNLDKYATVKLQQKLTIPKAARKIVQTENEVIKLSPRAEVKKVSLQKSTAIPVLKANKKRLAEDSGHDFLPKRDASLYRVANIHQKNGTTHGHIIVQPEESFELYGNWLGKTKASLLALNGLAPGAAVTPGQQLLLVFDRLTPALFEKKRLAFLQEKEKTFLSAFTIIGQKIYQVISGDTLWDICYNKFDVPLWLLKRYNNNINLASLDQEQELIIPIIQQI